MTRNSLLSWFIVLVSVGFFASPRNAQAQTNPNLVLASFGAQLSAGEGNNITVPIDLPTLNHSGLNPVTLVGTGPSGPSSASVAVNVLNPQNLSSPEHFQIVQTVGTTGSDITQSIVSFFATSSIKTSIGVQSVLSVTYSSGPTDINLINTGIDIQFSDGTKLFECTTIPPFPTPPCIVVTPGGFSVTWSKQSSSVTSVTGSLLLTLADLAYVATLTTDIEVIQDSVILNNTTLSQGNGVWVNGIANGAQWNHQTFSPQNSAMFPTPGSSDSVTIPMGGNVQASPPGTENGNEVVAFALQRPVAIRTDVPWTDFTDNIQLTFDNEIEIPIQVWVLTSLFPYATTARTASTEVSIADSIFHRQHIGILPVLMDVEDKTGDPAAKQFLKFNNTNNPKFTCLSQMQALVKNWYTKGMINVYFVDQVKDAIAESCITGSGFNAFVISARPNTDSLAHELGHQMGLAHPGGLGSLTVLDFNENNLMWGNGIERSVDFLTEGQIFRALLSTFSSVNILGSRHGGLTRDCDDPSSLDSGGYLSETPTLACPAINKRIFPEGGQQPN